MIKIVIVEDHPVTMRGLENLLQDNKDIVILGTASRGILGKTLVETHRPDVAVLDVSLPDIGGEELARWITEHHIATRILVYSMQKDYATIDAMLHAGASGYVLKDDPLESLEEGLREVGAGRSYFTLEVKNVMVAARLNGLKSLQTTLPIELSRREVDVVRLVAQGLENKDIAEKLCISISTVETHISRVMDKTGRRNGRALVRWAMENGYG